MDQSIQNPWSMGQAPNCNCNCRSLFLFGPEGTIWAPPDKVAFQAYGGFTYQVCKFAEQDVLKWRANNKHHHSSGNSNSNSNTAEASRMMLHYNSIVISIGGVCLDGTGKGVVRADAGIYLGWHNPHNGGAVVNTKLYADGPPTIQLAYLVGLGEALDRGKVVAGDGSFMKGVIWSHGGGGGSHENFMMSFGASAGNAHAVPKGKKKKNKSVAEGEEGNADLLSNGPSKKLERIIIKTDSDYLVMDVMAHIQKWARNGWRTSKGKEVKNRRELEAVWAHIVDLHRLGVEVVFHKVPRSANEEAVQMAIMGSHRNMTAKSRRKFAVIPWSETF